MFDFRFIVYFDLYMASKPSGIDPVLWDLTPINVSNKRELLKFLY